MAIVDGFTKFIKLYPTKSTSTKDVIACCQNYFEMYSRPTRMISDRGTGFTSKEFKEFLKENCVKHVLIAAGCPRSNGQIERMNRTLTPMLAKLIDKERNKYWAEVLPEAEFVFNNVISKSTGMALSFLLFGVHQKGKVNDKIKEYLENVLDKPTDVHMVRDIASKNIENCQKNNEIYYNKKRKESHMYKEGELVLISNVDTTIGVNKKLIPKYKGPYRIYKCLGNDRYIIKDVDGFQMTSREFESVFDSNRLKPYLKID